MSAPPPDTPAPEEIDRGEAEPCPRGGSLLPHRRGELVKEAVEEASDESFPASDAPGWTAVRAA